MTNRVVIDASVVVKWFFAEDLTKEADSVRRERKRLFAPDFIYAELANVVWKKYNRHEVDMKEAQTVIDSISTLQFALQPSRILVQSAYDIAAKYRASVYDCLYLAIAVKRDAYFITADKRFVTALAGSPFASHIRYLGDI